MALQKKAIKEPQKDPSRYAINIVNSSDDAIITESLDGNILSWNPAAGRMFGYTREEVIGKPMSIIGPPEKKQEFDRLIDKVSKGEEIERYETDRRKKDGTLLRVSVTISPIKDDTGKIVGILAIDRDVTKRAEASQYARSLIEASLDPLVTISADGKITDVNEASINATGATREELIGSKFSEYFTEQDKAEEGYKKVLKEGVVRDYPLTIKHKNGKMMEVLYNASVYKDVQGNVLGVFAAARDVTEQRQATQYARSLLEASLDPLVTISPKGEITDVNEATIKATGATKEELIGSRFSDYFTEPEKAEEGYQTVLKKGFVSDYALTIKHKAGKLMDVLYNASVYKDIKGKVIGVFAAARDVTKTKQASQYARSLIEASVDPLVTISPDGKITDVNEASIEATGVKREELIGANFSDYFTEPSKAEAGYQQVLREGSVKDYPLTIKNKNGTLMDVSYNASVYKDARGKVIGVFAAARDVTATKRASQYSRSLIEASMDPLVTISPQGKITDVNRATIEVTGVPKRELIGSDFSLYFTVPEKARQGYLEAFKKGEVRDYLLTIRSRLGKETPVLYNASVYKDEKGKVLGVFAAAREIGKAELKAAQARELQRLSKQLVFKVALSRKMGVGSAKMNEKDAGKAGLEIVDNVTIKPTRKEISARRVDALSMTSSRMPEGVIVISYADSRVLGLEEADTVFVTKSGAEEEAVSDTHDTSNVAPYDTGAQTVTDTITSDNESSAPTELSDGNVEGTKEQEVETEQTDSTEVSAEQGTSEEGNEVQEIGAEQTASEEKPEGEELSAEQETSTESTEGQVVGAEQSSGEEEKQNDNSTADQELLDSEDNNNQEASKEERVLEEDREQKDDPEITEEPKEEVKEETTPNQAGEEPKVSEKSKLSKKKKTLKSSPKDKNQKNFEAQIDNIRNN